MIDGLIFPIITIAKRFVFEDLKIIPQHWRRDLLNLIIGSHDPRAQRFVNEILPVMVFNLSITQPEVIENTHQRMKELYHTSGGEWQRENMPRTVMVFLNTDEGKPSEERNALAQAHANQALSAYWKAIQGTLDPQKVARAANNALVGPKPWQDKSLNAFIPMIV